MKHKLYKGDCLEIMKSISSESVDLVIVDPPYKLNKTTGSSTSSSKKESWQGMLKAGDKNANIENNIKFSDWLPEAYRILKEQSHFYVFVNDKNVQDMLNEATKVGFKLHNIIVWKKNNCTPNRWYMKSCEFVLFFRKGKSFPINELGTNQCLESPLFEVDSVNGKKKLHPTQKPVEIIEKFISNSSKCGDVVADFFMGSGSTGVACMNTNRRFIGIELDDKYFDIAKNRTNEHIEKNNIKCEIEVYQ